MGSESVETESDKDEFDLSQALLDACATIPENLLAVADNVLDPLGLDIGGMSTLDEAAENQEVTTDTFKAMRSSFDGQAAAFAYLLFILLYAPCVAATAAVYRETNTQWAVFVVFWTTGLAYMTATIYYQLATYSQHPSYSLQWILGLIFALTCVIAGLWLYGKSLENAPIKKEDSHDFI
jgi:ferrous iron transport protein B